MSEQQTEYVWAYSDEKPKRGRTWLIVGLAVAAVVIAALVFWLFLRPGAPLASATPTPSASPSVSASPSASGSAAPSATPEPSETAVPTPPPVMRPATLHRARRRPKATWAQARARWWASSSARSTR